MTSQAQTQLIDQEFQQQPGIWYLNHAAIGPWPLRTVQRVTELAQGSNTRIMANWLDWYGAEQRLRQRLGDLIGASDGSQVSLTKNTSEGLSRIAAGLDWRDGDRVLVLSEEFSSNQWCWDHCTPASVTVDSVKRQPGQPVHEALIEATTPQTRLISVSTVQYANGTALLLKELSQHCRERGILLVVDAIQSLGAFPLDVTDCPVDAVACGSHKWLLSAEGVGFLYLSDSLRQALKPTQVGWRMVSEPFKFAGALSETASDGRGLEAGTLNTVGIVALEASLSLYQELGADSVEHIIRGHTKRLLGGLADLGVDVRTPADSAQHAGIVAFSLGDENATRDAYNALSEKGVFCAVRGGLLRLSPHYSTPPQHIDDVLNMVASVL
ncbi:MAG: aminotransferase class V-fold PLP-dependent enzyme [Pseudomonadota bacterium]